jgi:methionine-rich copper-binding protein CopC
VTLRRSLFLVLVAAVGALVPHAAGAHDDIAGSSPTSGAQLDEPIDRVVIDFGEPITDAVEMTLLFDLGGSDTETIPGTARKDGETTAVLEFEELSRPGRYFVRYLAPVPVDGHVVAGAITFEYGDLTGGTDWTVWIVFGLLSVVVIAAGAWFSFFRPVRPDPGTDGQVDADR